MGHYLKENKETANLIVSKLHENAALREKKRGGESSYVSLENAGYSNDK